MILRSPPAAAWRRRSCLGRAPCGQGPCRPHLVGNVRSVLASDVPVFV